MNSPQFRYTGDIKLLKSLGYKFHKLYANNYKAYNKNDLWLFVISKMIIEINNIDSDDQVKVIEFILLNKNEPDSFWKYKSKYRDLFFPRYQIIDNEIISIEEKRKRNYEPLSEQPRISLELVQQIIELNNIAALEKITLK